MEYFEHFHYCGINLGLLLCYSVCASQFEIMVHFANKAKPKFLQLFFFNTVLTKILDPGFAIIITFVDVKAILWTINLKKNIYCTFVVPLYYCLLNIFTLIFKWDGLTMRLFLLSWPIYIFCLKVITYNAKVITYNFNIIVFFIVLEWLLITLKQLFMILK